MPFTVSFTHSPDTTQGELDALAALIASLGGRAASPPYSVTAGSVSASAPTLEGLRALAPDAVATADGTPAAASDDLIAEEAARAAGRPTGSASGGEASSAGDSSQRDADGLPWDERIHSSSRAINESDGKWRRKRGVSEILVGEVTAELQERTAGNPKTEQEWQDRNGLSEDETSQPIAPPPPPPAVDVPNVPPPPPVAAPTASPALAATTAPEPSGNIHAKYQALMSRLSKSGLDYVQLNTQAQAFGLDKFASLAKRPEMVDDFAAHLEAMGLLTPQAEG